MTEKSQIAGSSRPSLALFLRRRFSDAAVEFALLAQATPDQASAPYLEARASLLAGDLPGARASCEQALRIAPDCYRGQLLMARIALATSNLALAQSHLDIAVKLRTRNADLRARLAEVMAARTQFRPAMEMAASALAIDANCFAARVVIARCQVAFGQFGKAQSLLSQLEAERPGYLSVAKVRALLSLRINRGSPGAATAPPRQDAKSAPPTPDPNGSASAGQSAKPPQVLAPAPANGDAAITLAPRPASSDIDADAEASRQFTASPSLDSISLRPGPLDHLFIIRALILRDLRLKHRDNPLGVAIELIRPIAVVVAHYFLFLVLSRPMAGNAPIAIFVLGGFSVWFAFSTTEQGAASGGKYPGGATSLPGVTDMHMRFARAVWGFLLNVCFCLVALVPLNLYGAGLPLPDILMTVPIFVVASCMGFGFGLLAERLSALWPIVKTLEKLLSWALFVSAGLYFSLSTMHPPIVAAVMWYNPLLHLIEFERHAFDPGYPISLVTPVYPTIMAVVLLFSGLIAFKWLPARD